jgi:rSAM/selenodomain-associated transferase 1
MSQVIGLFVKPVRPGQVKTRMTPALTMNQAAELYAALLTDTAALLQSGHERWDWVVFASEPDEVAATWPEKAPRPQNTKIQQGEDLGQRMDQALTDLFEMGYSRAMLLGSDHPNVPPAYLDQGFAALHHSDVALGPTSDGGYYTIGLTKSQPALFSGITYSQPTVFSETLGRVRSESLSLHCLPPWYDVDTVEDLRLLKSHLDALVLELGDRAPSPETRRFLESLQTL